MYRAVGDNERAIEMYQEALQNAQSIPESEEAVAENNYCLADSLFVNGDLEKALFHAIEAKKIREDIYGPMSQQIMESYYQVAQLATASLSNEETVVTPEVAKHIQMSISCYEKIFKFCKSKKNDNGNRQELMTLTKKIINFKFQLMNPNQKDIVRSLRKNDYQYPQEFLREVIVRLVALTPSSYIDNILSRLEKDDENALNELGAVIQIVEMRSIFVQ